MRTTTSAPEFLDRLAVVRQMCPQLRFGQFMATVGLLAEDVTGRNLWDPEDDEFAADLSRRQPDRAERVCDRGSSS